MAVQINRTPDSPGWFSKIISPVGSLVGAGVGTFALPGVGTAGGAAIGGALGAGAGALASNDKQTQGVPISQGAMQRRSEELANTDQHKLSEGLMALQHAPPEIQEQYGPDMIKAYQRMLG